MTEPMPHNARSVGNWILFAFTAPHAVLSWLLGALAIVTFFAHKPRFEGAGILSLELREWFSSGRDKKGPWRYSTTLIRTIFWGAGFRDYEEGNDASELDERHERHERVHIRQFEDDAFKGFWIGLFLAIALWAWGWNAELWQPALVWLVLWLIFPLLSVFHWITAMLRFGHTIGHKTDGKGTLRWLFDVAYRDSEHERSAYAQTNAWPGGGSWWARREEDRD